MSISRKNWSALSSLTRQWTVEDEEEVERERRRRVKSSSTTDPDGDSSPTLSNSSTGDNFSGTETSNETSKSLSREEQMQLDFLEMLRVRDEKRRMRHVEMLRQQKEGWEDDVEASGVGEYDGQVVLPEELEKEKSSGFEPQTSLKTSTFSLTKYNKANTANRQHEELSKEDSNPHQKPLTSPARKFVSSVSISLDKSPSASGRSTPMSPCSPAPSLSPREPWPSSSRSSSFHGAQSPVQNGHPQETILNGSSINSNFEQAAKPAFVRQSSRTISFRMMRKKEEESTPLQRSASVRIVKKVESNTKQCEEEDKPSSFQRNSRQRLSSRSIQEKMERLAQAAQKSELTRSPDVSQRTLFLLEEVSRKRSLFEKDQPAQSPISPGESRNEPKSFTSGMSDRINRWRNKSNQPGSSFSPSDLRHVDITSKKSVFEKREDNVSNVSPEKNYK